MAKSGIISNKPSIEKWEEEFDNEYLYVDVDGEKLVNINIHHPASYTKLKSFIRTLLSQSRQESAEEKRIINNIKATWVENHVGKIVPNGLSVEEMYYYNMDLARQEVIEEIEKMVDKLDENAGHDEAWYSAIRTVRELIQSIKKKYND